MLIKVLDGLSVSQIIIVPGQESVVDQSGTIASTNVSQSLLSANLLRSGWVMQNCGVAAMYVNNIGDASTGLGSFMVTAGSFFPPAGFPVTTAAVSIAGTAGDTYTVKEW